MMPSPRSSPAMRPTSPLSQRYEPSRFEAILQTPSSRGVPGRAAQNGWRAASSSLRLPTLPRFHPANFPSAHSSYQTTPEGENAAGAPLSPRTHQRMYSDAQKQLLLYQRESIASARATSPLREKPRSPRLLPLGSPGPVTPLELEGEEEYLAAGVKRSSMAAVHHQELVNSLIREEVRRSNKTSQQSGTRRYSNQQ